MQTHREFPSPSLLAGRAEFLGAESEDLGNSRSIPIPGSRNVKLLRNNSSRFLEDFRAKCRSYFTVNRVRRERRWFLWWETDSIAAAPLRQHSADRG